MEENNEGFGIAFVMITLVAFILPSIILLSVGDTWDRLLINMVLLSQPNVGKIVT